MLTLVLLLLAAPQVVVPSSGTSGKVAEAYAADASVYAVQAQNAYAADASVYAVQAQYLPITCGAGDFITCSGSACSCATPSGGGGGKVAEAYMADAAISAQWLTLTCTAGQYVTCTGSSCSCSTPSGGGGGSGNFAEAQVVLTTSGYFSQAVAASWVTASSRVVCGVFGTNDAGLTAEVVALAQLGVSIDTLNPGVGFTVSLLNLTGLEGTVAVHCTGG